VRSEFNRLNLNSLSLWERVRERALGFESFISYALFPQPFSQREKGEIEL
jgi:hypothetical protein